MAKNLHALSRHSEAAAAQGNPKSSLWAQVGLFCAAAGWWGAISAEHKQGLAQVPQTPSQTQREFPGVGAGFFSPVPPGSILRGPGAMGRRAQCGASPGDAAPVPL